MTWILMTGLGFGLVLLMRRTPPAVDFILSRIAAMLFLGAGTLLFVSGGWIATTLHKFAGWLTAQTDTLAGMILGGAVVGIIAIIWTGVWLAAMIPNKFVSLEYSEKLIYSGCGIPFLAATMPGAVGDAFRAALNGISDFTTMLVTGWF